jgi:hypothetical protein
MKFTFISRTITLFAAAITTESTTLSPTLKPIGPQIAVFDPEFGAPRCRLVGSACNTVELLNGVGTGESNASNTIDGCQDSPFNTNLDEMVQQIFIRSELGGPLAMGNGLTFIIVVKAADDTSARDQPNDFHFAALFYASDARNANWQYKGRAAILSGSGTKQLRGNFTLRAGETTQVSIFLLVGKEFPYPDHSSRVLIIGFEARLQLR